MNKSYEGQEGFCPRCKEYTKYDNDSWDADLEEYVCGLCDWLLVHPGDLIDEAYERMKDADNVVPDR